MTSFPTARQTLCEGFCCQAPSDPARRSYPERLRWSSPSPHYAATAISKAKLSLATIAFDLITGINRAKDMNFFVCRSCFAPIINAGEARRGAAHFPDHGPRPCMPVRVITPPVHPWSGSALMVEARGTAPRSSPLQRKSFIAIVRPKQDGANIVI